MHHNLVFGRVTIGVTITKCVVSVCGDKQGRAGRPGQTPAHSKSFSVTPGKATGVVSIYVGSAWKILSVTAPFLWSFPRCNSPDITDSREKRNQGQSRNLRQKIW